jgi:hypothetical protein
MTDRAEPYEIAAGNRCRWCGERMAWPDPAGVVEATGTALHHHCYHEAEVAWHEAREQQQRAALATGDFAGQPVYWVKGLLKRHVQLALGDETPLTTGPDPALEAEIADRIMSAIVALPGGLSRAEAHKLCVAEAHFWLLAYSAELAA